MTKTMGHSSCTLQVVNMAHSLGTPLYCPQIWDHMVSSNVPKPVPKPDHISSRSLGFTSRKA